MSIIVEHSPHFYRSGTAFEEYVWSNWWLGNFPTNDGTRRLGASSDPFSGGVKIRRRRKPASVPNQV